MKSLNLKIVTGVLVALALLAVGITAFGVYQARAQGEDCGLKVSTPLGVLCFSEWVQNVKDVQDEVVNSGLVAPEESLGGPAGPDIHGPVTLREGVTEVPRHGATTTTGSAATLLVKDVITAQYNVVTFGGAVDTDFTYTTPASSTLSQILPAIGSETKRCWFNVASSTSVHTLIFAAGTGVDFVVASTSDDQLSVPVPIGAEEGDELCITFRAMPRSTDVAQRGDINAIVELYTDLD